MRAQSSGLDSKASPSTPQHCWVMWEGQSFCRLSGRSIDRCSNSALGVCQRSPVSARAQASPNVESEWLTSRFESPRSCRILPRGARASTTCPAALTSARTAVTTSGPRRAPRPFSSTPTRQEESPLRIAGHLYRTRLKPLPCGGTVLTLAVGLAGPFDPHERIERRLAAVRRRGTTERSPLGVAP